MLIHYMKGDSPYCIIFGFHSTAYALKSCETSRLAKTVNIRYHKSTERVIPMI